MASKVLGPRNRKTGQKIYRYNKGTFDLSLFDDVFRDFKFINMDKLRLFQYAVILHKYKQTKENNGKIYEGAEVIVEPKTVLAKNEKEVVFRATREVPTEKADDPDNVEILVRPF